MLQRYRSVAELADMTGISRHRIYDAIKRGDLPALTFNGNSRGWRIVERDFEEWLEREKRRGMELAG
jgi:excisionase family DNA binding protein